MHDAPMLSAHSVHGAGTFHYCILFLSLHRHASMPRAMPFTLLILLIPCNNGEQLLWYSAPLPRPPPTLTATVMLTILRYCPEMGSNFRSEEAKVPELPSNAYRRLYVNHGKQHASQLCHLTMIAVHYHQAHHQATHVKL
jgi:hypothetical protein